MSKPILTVPPIACPNCQDIGETTRLLFNTEDFEGCAYGDEGQEVQGGIIGVTIDAKMMCPVCGYWEYFTIALDFTQNVITADGQEIRDSVVWYIRVSKLENERLAESARIGLERLNERAREGELHV